MATVKPDDTICPDCGGELTYVRCPCHRACKNCGTVHEVDLQTVDDWSKKL